MSILDETPEQIERIDKGADALRHFEMKGRVLLPWDMISTAQREKWREKVRTVLRAAQ